MSSSADATGTGVPTRPERTRRWPAAAALSWTVGGGGTDGFRLGVTVLLGAVLLGVGSVVRPTLRRAAAA